MKIQDLQAQKSTDRLFDAGPRGSWCFVSRAEISAAIRAAKRGTLDAWQRGLKKRYRDLEGQGFVLAVLYEAWQRLAAMRKLMKRERRASGHGFRSALAGAHYRRRTRRAEIDREAFQRSGGFENLVADRNPMRLLFSA